MQEAFGINEESVFRAASGLHGGMSRGDVCGSLMGASLMIGLICGKSVEDSSLEPAPTSTDDWGIASKLVGEIYDWYAQEFGSVKCDDVRGGYEAETIAAAGDKKLTEQEIVDGFHAKCDVLCARTAARAVELLWEHFKK